jgi:hypothetical protein
MERPTLVFDGKRYVYNAHEGRLFVTPIRPPGYWKSHTPRLGQGEDDEVVYSEPEASIIYNQINRCLSGKSTV